ncbi:MAG: NAD-dependent epimerase/dehydratase family protein [Rhodospirillaceae bacterium]|nr:NAD-dependent epimerase/dehydratase family protein [Rhodospirillaceae bacterium]
MAHTIWITGAAGFIGGAAARHFANDGWRVVGFDRRRPDLSFPTASFHVAPIEAWILEAAFKALGPPDAVFHGAGTGTVGQAQAEPDQARSDTVGTTEVLVTTLSRLAPGCRVVYPSSAAVYGSTNDDPIREDTATAPISNYGKFKLETEAVCRTAAEAGRIHIGVVRFFSVYGPGLRKQLPWELGQKLLKGDGSATLFGTGFETRDFLFIDDAIALIRTLIESPAPGLTIVNGGTGTATTIADFAKLFSSALGVSGKIGFSGEVKPGDPRHFRACTKKSAALGFKPRVQLNDGLKRYADWIKAEA